MAPVLGYWDIRGLAQPIRLLLAHMDVKVEDKRYSCGPPPDFDRSAWLKDKPNLGLEFPNLPYYLDGDVKITQSMAILRYLARKHGLEGKSDAEKLRVDMAEQQFADFRMNWVRLCYNPDFDKLKGDYLKGLPASLKAFSDFLGSHKYFAGENLTYVDFIAYEMLSQHLLFAPDCLKEHANLKAFVDRIERPGPRSASSERTLQRAPATVRKCGRTSGITSTGHSGTSSEPLTQAPYGLSEVIPLTCT